MVSHNQVSVIGAAFAGGQKKGGVEKGSQFLREAGLIQMLTGSGYLVQDIGDCLVDQNTGGSQSDEKYNIYNPDGVGRHCRELYNTVKKQAEQNHFVLTIGGDHSIAIGSISAILETRPETGIIWVDAHADINTPFTSPTGNMHGMPVSILMGLFQIPQCDWIKSKLDFSKIAYIGLRDVDPGEVEIIKRHNITAFFMEDVRRLGIETVMHNAFAAIQNESRTLPVHLSFDIDGLDMTEAPATGTAVADGLTLTEGRYIAQYLRDTGLLGSLDIVEINPDLANTPEELTKTVSAGLQIIEVALGCRTVDTSHPTTM